jgi:hypothetical protein
MIVEDNNEEEKVEQLLYNESYADRDMCSFCFGEIYLNEPARVCQKNAEE